MPIYEYRCKPCSHQFENLQEMNDTSPAQCPKCGKPAERVIPTRTGVIMGSNSKSCCGREEGCTQTPHTCGGGCGCK